MENGQRDVYRRGEREREKEGFWKMTFPRGVDEDQRGISLTKAEQDVGKR